MRLAHQLFGARVGKVVPSSPTSFSSVTGPGTSPQFSSLIVSRPRSASRALARVRGLLLSAALYGVGLTFLILSPILILEVMPPPKAGITPSIPTFFPPRGHGDRHPAGPMPKGVRGGRTSAAAAAAPRKTPAAVHPQTPRPLTPPLEPDMSLTAGTSEDGPTGMERGGDPNGTLEGTSDSPGCLSCTGKGLGPPGDPEGPYEQGTEGLIPPSLIPGTRALPAYPDIARRAGLQGSVILLAVIEADGTVGEIQVVRNADPRWGFDLAAIEAVKRWRYQPALMNGAPVAAYIQVMVEFSLAR